MLLSYFTLFALASIGAAVPATISAAASEPKVTVKNGTLLGAYSSEYKQDFFLGIPFAQPPIGDLRFRNPQPLNSSWTGTRNAQNYSVECIGYSSDQWGYDISEDCLYLNVVRPSGYENTPLPVAFWIHGGGFNAGGGVDKRYNLSFIVENSVSIGKPIIGVSINYRLSAWGFLNSLEVFGTGQTNIGLRDQRLALRWVQENIAAFGGDSSKVTIWGESAGAGSVGLHLTAFGGRDDKLFRAAVMQSGSPIHYAALPESYQPMYNSIVTQAGCSNSTDTLQCLRGVPYASLNAIINGTTTGVKLIGFGPSIDGDFIQKYTSVQLTEGSFVKVPVIAGANSDEGTSFKSRGANATVNTSEDFYRSITSQGIVRPAPASLAKKLLEAYPDDPSVNVIASFGLNRPDPQYGTQFRRVSSYEIGRAHV